MKEHIPKSATVTGPKILTLYNENINKINVNA